MTLIEEIEQRLTARGLSCVSGIVVRRMEMLGGVIVSGVVDPFGAYSARIKSGPIAEQFVDQIAAAIDKRRREATEQATPISSTL